MSDARTFDLLLWRHAEAGEGRPDTARPLTSKGQRQAQRVAAWLQEHAPGDLRILVSPAVRARQTVAPYSSEYAVTEAVGLATTPEALLAATGWPNGEGAVLVVGHQPTLGQVAAHLLGAGFSEIPFKKGTLWWFRMREREGHRETALRAVVAPDLL